MQYHVLRSRAITTFYSFHIQMRKIPSREREIKRRGRCWHVYRQQQRVLVSTWERENGTPLRSAGGTQVSANTSAPGPMAEWCLRDKAEAYKPRHAPQGPLLQCRHSLYLAFLLSSYIASQSGSGHAGRYNEWHHWVQVSAKESSGGCVDVFLSYSDGRFDCNAH